MLFETVSKFAAGTDHNGSSRCAAHAVEYVQANYQMALHALHEHQK